MYASESYPNTLPQSLHRFYFFLMLFWTFPTCLLKIMVVDRQKALLS